MHRKHVQLHHLSPTTKQRPQVWQSPPQIPMAEFLDVGPGLHGDPSIKGGVTSMRNITTM